MAATAATLIAGAQGLSYAALSDRNTLLSLVGVYATPFALTAQQAVEAAATLKYAMLSERDLVECILKGVQ